MRIPLKNMVVVYALVLYCYKSMKVKIQPPSSTSHILRALLTNDMHYFQAQMINLNRNIEILQTLL